MRRVGTEVAAAVGAQLLDRDFGRRHAARDHLLPAFDRGRSGGAGVCHRRALPQHQRPNQQRQRQQHAHRRPRAIDVKVAERCRAIGRQAAHHCDARRHAGRRRDELEKDDHEQLRDVRQPGLAAVVLQVGVRHKARDRVECQRRLHGTDAVRIERQQVLRCDQRKCRAPHHAVRQQERQRILLPVLRCGRAQAAEPSHQPVDRREYGIEYRPPISEDGIQVAAEKIAGRDGEGDRDNDREHVDSHGLELFRTQHRVEQIAEREHGQREHEYRHDVTSDRRTRQTRTSRQRTRGRGPAFPTAASHSPNGSRRIETPRQESATAASRSVGLRGP
jgi:hypothetical protein